MKIRFFPDLAAGFFLYIENPARSFVGAAGNRSFLQDPARMPVNAGAILQAQCQKLIFFYDLNIIYGKFYHRYQ